MSASLLAALLVREADSRHSQTWPPAVGRQSTLSNVRHVEKVFGNANLTALIFAALPARPVHAWLGAACACRAFYRSRKEELDELVNRHATYRDEYEIARALGQPCDPSYLELALRLSTFLFEVAARKQEAIKLAAGAFHDADFDVGRMDEETWAAALPGMARLRDHLTHWSQEDFNENAENWEEDDTCQDSAESL